MQKLKIVLFDIDSTLLKDGGAATGAFDTAFIEMFGSMPARVDKHGKTDPDITREIALATIGRSLTDGEDARLRLRYCELFPEFLEKSAGFSIMNGAIDLCSYLSENPAFLCGIQTGNLEISARMKLKKAKLDHFFPFGGFGSDASERVSVVRTGIERGLRHAAVSAGEAVVIVIGDSRLDIMAGNRNKAFTIGVATGKDSREELAAAHAAAVVSDLTKASGIHEILMQPFFS